MIEKRFTYDKMVIGCDGIEHYVKHIYDDGKLLDMEEVVEILNEQSEYIDYVTKERNLACNKLDNYKKKVWELKKEIQLLEKVNEDLQEVNKENQLLHEENVKQCERWKKLYEIKDAEVTARVKSLQNFCNNYFNNKCFKSDTDPNVAVKEVLNELLHSEIKLED